MRNNFCTVLNLGYLTRGLVLYHSLARVCPEFRLYVACMDSDSASLLKRLQLPSLTVIEGEQLEAYDPELAAAKSTRGIGDYCKTAKPTLCLYLLEQVPEAELITFLDADLMFFNDPGPMFDELGDASIMLMPMRRGPKRREEKDKRFGPYNSGTVGFRRAEPGPAALRWWRDRCLEWSPGDHPLLDQPFVSDWPERFEAVHVVEHIGCGVAPWNVFQYRVESENGAPLVDGVPVIFYHYTMFTPFHSVNSFHRTRFLAPPRRFTIGALPLFWQMGAPYGIAPGETELIWEPYVREFGEAILEARRLDPSFTAGLVDAGRPVDESSTARRRRAVSVDRQRGPSAYQAIRAWGRPLEPVWWEPEPGGDQHWEVRVTDEGDLRVECRLPGDEAFYVRQGEEGFHKTPRGRQYLGGEPRDLLRADRGGELRGRRDRCGRVRDRI